MLRPLAPGEKVTTNGFGGFYPYWTKVRSQVFVADTFEEIIQVVPECQRIVDPTGFLELLNFNYMLGQRTIVDGVNRLLWRSTLDSEGVISRRPPIPHGNKRMNAARAAKELENLLADELVRTCTTYNRVFLLLTGGLDSRIVAGILKKNERNIDSEIICATWGGVDSRDVEYAGRIAAWYDWKFIKLEYEHSFENIKQGAIWGGTEVAGIHLHSMQKLREYVNHDDLVLAASFGDSIGRAEYSGVHVKNLTSPTIRNVSGLIHYKLDRQCIQKAYGDLATAWEQEPSNEKIARYELSQQENYMRRMIVHAMNYIRNFSNVYQAFTSENIVRFMWSLSPECRTDAVYYQLLKHLDYRLFDLPWARNGIAPSGTKEENLQLEKEYHQWGKHLRMHFKERLKLLYFSQELSKLGIFNHVALRRYWQKWKSSNDSLSVGQNIVKICSLEITRHHFKLLPSRKETPQQDNVYDLLSRGKNKIFAALLQK